jgi:hypothetical protein
MLSVIMLNVIWLSVAAPLLVGFIIKRSDLQAIMDLAKEDFQKTFFSLQIQF